MKNVILIYLAKHNKINLLQKVIKKHEDLNIQDFDGNTALIWAAKNDNFSMCKILIDAGSDWCVFNNDDKSFLDYLGGSREHIINIYKDKYELFLAKINKEKYKL